MYNNHKSFINLIEIIINLKKLFNDNIRSGEDLAVELEDQIKKASKNFKNGRCAICNEEITEFKDKISFLEYSISGKAPNPTFLCRTGRKISSKQS